MKLKTLAGLLAVAGLAMPGMASATNGMNAMGVGVKEQGMGGASIAFVQSAMAGATNPAAMTTVGDRIDFGLSWFSPHRAASNPATTDSYHDSGSNNFAIPEFGYNMMMGDKMSLGVVVYGNGGMNTDYNNKFFGTTNTYSNIEQLFIAPTMAYDIAPGQSVGVSLNLVYQTADFKGLEGFEGIKSSNPGSPDNLTGQGKDTSTGAGLRLGYMGKMSPTVTVGAFWQPRTRMTKFDKYSQLFAEHGGFDIPETYGLGLGLKASDKVSVAADLVQINYSKVKSIGNLNGTGTTLGADNGPGFGWKDVTVLKLGVAYEYRPDLTLRAGWNHGNNPLQSGQTTFNILAPATITDHVSVGATWALANKSELTVTYWHGFNKEIKGDGVAGVSKADLKMYQDNLGVAYGWKF